MRTPYCEGNNEAKLLFIAEAPARWEIIEGRPLVGDTGKLWNQLLHSAGIQRSDVLIHNCSRTRIESIDHLMTDRGVLTKAGQEVAHDLISRIKDSQANVIVTMGALATKILTGHHEILKYRGSVLEDSCGLGKKVLPTIHPSATLPRRGPYIWRYLIILDYEKALRESAFPDIRLPKLHIVTRPTFSEATDYLRWCMKYTRLAFDIETMNHQVSCISFTPKKHHAISIPLVGDHGDYWSESQEAQIWKMIGHLLGSERSTKIGSNITGFDIPFLLRQNKILVRGPIHDTMVAARTLWHEFKSSLEFLTSIYTPYPYYKDDRKFWNRIRDAIDRFWRYNAMDSITAFEIAEEQDKEFLEDPAMLHTYRMRIEAFDPCLFMMERGIEVDEGHLKADAERTKKLIEEKMKELHLVTGVALNPNSTPQCKAYFYEGLRIKPYMKATKGPGGKREYRQTLDDKALARIARRSDLPSEACQAAKLIQELRGMQKLLGTYLEMKFDKDGRMRCTYNVSGAKTGRLSSAKTAWGTGMNNQNLDPRFTHFLVP